MESDTDRRTETEAPEDSGRLSRLVAEIRGLVEDARTWIDLKLKLLEVQIEDRVREAVNRVAVLAIVATLAFLAVVFALVTSALALNAWWDSDVLGFLAITLVLVVVTSLVYVLRPTAVGRGEREEPKPELRAPEARPRLGAGPKPETTPAPAPAEEKSPGGAGHE